MRFLAGLCCFAALSLSALLPAAAKDRPTSEDLAVPRYAHVFVIMDENKDAVEIDGSDNAPFFTHLARAYGNATHFYGEVHPSEANYVALLGGSTFGIHDDDAYYCVPGSSALPNCDGAGAPGYAAHNMNAPHLGTQLDAAGLTWKGYYQSIPEPGSGAVKGMNPAQDGPHAPEYYSSKHSGFLNFLSVQRDPARAKHLVGFDALRNDLVGDAAPNFALIVPNLCDDMHGMRDSNVPEDCRYEHYGDLIRRGDKAIERLVNMITASKLWQARENAAIVVTFDEGGNKFVREGCCGVTPDAPSNFGGGHIATIVITNHGPRGVVDATPYNHYSLLRTIEDAFGIHTYLGIAARSDQGVRPMLPLFGGTGSK